MIDPRGYQWLEEGDDAEAAYLWRLMTDARRQGRAFGRGAIGQAVEVARGWGLRRLAVSVVDRPGGAMGLYGALGFRRTGRIADGEAVIVLDLG
jgi:diamine N-acetyltransferase